MFGLEGPGSGGIRSAWNQGVKRERMVEVRTRSRKQQIWFIHPVRE